MKHFNYLILFVVSIFVFSGCSPEDSTLSSSKGELDITVSAKRYVVGDPWLVSVELSMVGLDKPAKAEREIMAEEISEKNVTFDWKDEMTCIVKIEQRNGEIVQIPVRVR